MGVVELLDRCKHMFDGQTAIGLENSLSNFLCKLFILYAVQSPFHVTWSFDETLEHGPAPGVIPKFFPQKRLQDLLDSLVLAQSLDQLLLRVGQLSHHRRSRLPL